MACGQLPTNGLERVKSRQGSALQGTGADGSEAKETLVGSSLSSTYSRHALRAREQTAGHRERSDFLLNRYLLTALALDTLRLLIVSSA
jgi:hypothetical protein